MQLLFVTNTEVAREAENTAVVNENAAQEKVNAQ